MKYFKNTELAKLYNVSEKSVRNWISAAKQGKIDLALYEIAERPYIINSSKNLAAVEELVHNGKKYKNSRGHKLIRPSENFYQLFDSKAIFDIVANLDVHHEIPLQYSYFDGGATFWDEYVQRLAEEKAPNILSNTTGLIDLNLPYLEQLLEGSAKINVVDIGPGNCYPARKLLEHLVNTGRLNRYICVDISPDMLRIAKRNITKWFGDKVKFEAYTRDITYERLDDLIAPDSFGTKATMRNLVLYLGGTVSNFRKPHHSINTIHDSLGRNDLLIFTKQLDTERARRYFDFATPQQARDYVLPAKSKFMVELFNIDPSLYDVEVFFDEQKMARRGQLRLKVALSIEFEIDGKTRTVNFNKGDYILIYRHIHQTSFQTIVEFDACGFDPIVSMKSRDGECLFSIFTIKTETA